MDPKQADEMKRPAAGAPGAALKYDLLTALSSWALAQEKTVQRQVLRLICLITARYNWQQDLLQISQAEIATLWSVDVRTVKRELAAFRDRGWLVQKARAGRYSQTALGLNIARILQDTRDHWDLAGPALAQRLAPAPMTVPAQVIAFPQPDRAPCRWSELSDRLAAQDPAVYTAWFAALTLVSDTDELILRAPSDFHASYVSTHFLRRLEQLSGTAVRLIA